MLVNNAGTWLTRREETDEGIERTWATNMLGYFLLTEALRPLLARSAPARVVNVASELAHDLDLSDVEFERRPYEGVTAYAQSKQANRMWTWALARRLEGTGVTANAMHPGGVNTPLFRKGGGWKSLAARGLRPRDGEDAGRRRGHGHPPGRGPRGRGRQRALLGGPRGAVLPFPRPGGRGSAVGAV